MKKTAAWVGVTIGAAVALPAVLAWFFLHPPRRRHWQTPKSALGLDYERVILRTDDGVRLSAWHVPHPAPRGFVILSHGYTSCRETMLHYLAFLHAGGFSALLYDFRAHGWSGGKQATLGLTETNDLRAAIHWVLSDPERAALPLVLVGESMGGAVSLLTAAEEPHVHAVVADCAFARLDAPIQRRIQTLFGDPIGSVIAPPTQWVGERMLGVPAAQIAPEERIAQIAPRPVFLIHGMQDVFVTPDNAHRLHAAAGENVALWLVEGAAHASSVRTAPDYGERVLAFLDQALAAM